MEGNFSLSGFRVFGTGQGIAPSKVAGFRAVRDQQDKRIYRFIWEAQKGGYGLRIALGNSKG